MSEEQEQLPAPEEGAPADPVSKVAALRKRFDDAPLAVRVGILAAAASILIGALAFSFSEGEPELEVLFSGLAEQDAARITERLDAAGTPYELEQGGTTILVAENEVHASRLMLAGEGLPRGAGVGFEVFDEQRFGESEFSENVKFHRALEGELARTISHLSGVRQARVHIVLPERSFFLDEEQTATASVVLHVKPGWRIGKEQVAGIIHLVASSVRGLSAERVTVVDGEGRKLEATESDEDESGGKVKDAVAYRREVEQSKEQAIQQILDATLGRGRSVVRVSAKVDFSRQEWTEERFDHEHPVERSLQITDEREVEEGQTVAGVPGAASNLPGGTDATQLAEGQGTARHSETRNFEISKVTRRAIEPVGKVTGLQVAVAVDGRWEGLGADRKFTPLSDEEVSRLQGLVAHAAGVDTERGDGVVVECVPFAEVEEGPKVSRAEQLIQRWGLHGAALLVVLIAALTAVVFLRRRRAAAAEAEAAALALAAEAQSEAELGPVLTQEGELLSEQEQERLERGEDPYAQPHSMLQDALDSHPGSLEEIHKLASDLAAREPDAAAAVIRGWLSETNP